MESTANNMRADVQKAFGQVAQPIEHPTQREEAMSFSKSGVRVNFNLNGYWDANKEIIDETNKFLNACSNRRSIFSCSCSLQRGAPLGSIKIMCDTVMNNIMTLRT